MQSGLAGSCQHPRISIQDTSTKNSSSRGSTTVTSSTLEPISEFDELDELKLKLSATDYNLLQASQNIISTAMGSGSDESDLDNDLL